MRTWNDVLRSATDAYFAGVNLVSPPPPSVVEQELLTLLQEEIRLENKDAEKDARLPVPTTLPHFVTAECLLHFTQVRRLIWSGSDADLNYDLVMYCDTGPNAGLYVTDEMVFRRKIREYNHNISLKGMDEVLAVLAEQADTAVLTRTPNLIPVNNGVFDYETKTLLPFTPDWVFTSKSRVDYNPNATSPTIHNNEDGTDWDVESWISDLTDDPELTELIWQIIGAIIRPNVAWDKVVCFYSEQGNNGKGTLCELMRNLCGKGSYASISFAAFGQEFLLEQLTHVSAVIADENATNSFTKDIANLKAVITGDYVTINRKFQKAITFQFKGLLVECINDLPRFGDKSDSWYRRLLIVPFEKSFTGHERKYIKHDYLKRKDVLEYVLYRVLHMDYQQFSEPEICAELLDEYKMFNDPVRDFLATILPELQWDLVPYAFLYELYLAWVKATNPGGKPVSRMNLIKDIKQLLRNSTEWVAKDTGTPSRHLLDAPEPLIAQYNLTNWMNTTYKGTDVNRQCTLSSKKSAYRGIKRLVPLAEEAPDEENDECP